jgi:hypothetical protein
MAQVVKVKSQTVYSVHPGVADMQDWVANLKAKTGRTLTEWIRLVKSAGPASEEQRRDWLKREHKLGTNSAWWIAERAAGKGEDDTPEGYLKAAPRWVDEMYAGGKAGLRPVHDRLVQIGRKLGEDVRVCPCQTIVPLYRNHVFAQIKPSTRTRVDLGLALAKAKAKLPKRLIDTGGAAKKDRITHCFAIGSLADIDDEVQHWLKIAYDLDA